VGTGPQRPNFTSANATNAPRRRIAIDSSTPDVYLLRHAVMRLVFEQPPVVRTR
jgi:hypothetical protein